MTRARWLTDVGVALVVATAGLVEVWLLEDTVPGRRAQVVSTVGIVWFAAHLSLRRRRPWVSLLALIVWPVVSVTMGGDLPLLFFGQLVPVMVLVYSLARLARGRLRWVGPLCSVAFITFADLVMPLLQEPSELVYHWGSITLSYLIGYSLRSAEERAAREAVRAHEAESMVRERELAAIADERARIARELHDIVAHSMSVIVVQAGAAQQVVEEDPAFARTALSTIRTTGSSALTEMRRLVGVLRTPEPGAEYAPQPGIGSLPELVEHARSSGLDVALRVTGDRGEVPAGVDLAAYRIVQEALTNVRRHSEADRADVSLDLGDETLRIEVSDSGPARPRAGSPGHGLVGMRERAALYGGRVEAVPERGGFVVRAELPLERV